MNAFLKLEGFFKLFNILGSKAHLFLGFIRLEFFKPYDGVAKCGSFFQRWTKEKPLPLLLIRRVDLVVLAIVVVRVLERLLFSNRIILIVIDFDLLCFPGRLIWSWLRRFFWNLRSSLSSSSNVMGL